MDNCTKVNTNREAFHGIFLTVQPGFNLRTMRHSRPLQASKRALAS
jgi:hypothetical protein